MFDSKQAGRLLRQDWNNPVDLARELYNMLTSKEARKVNSPVQIQVPQGQTGLTISRATTTAASTNRPPGPPVARPNRTQIPETKKPDLYKSEVDGPRAIPDSADSSFNRPPSSEPNSDFRPASDSKPTAAAPSEPISGTSKLQFSPGLGGASNLLPDYNRSGPSFSPPSNYAKRYQSPVLEASGEIRFSGITPVQFDVPPRVFNPVTDEYEPYEFDGSLTRIPIDEDGGGSGALWGKVISGSSDTYICNIYPDPDPETKPSDQASVKIVGGIDPADAIPVDTWIYPVVPNSAGTQYYGKISLWI